MSWEHFFAMGGYGDYIWSAYLVVAVTLIANIWVPLHSRTAVLRRLRTPADTSPPPRAVHATPSRNGPRGATRTGGTRHGRPRTARKVK